MLASFLLLGALLPNIEVGQKPTPPAQIAGPWETLVAPREVAGFSLLIITRENGSVRLLRLDTYDRKQEKTTRTWWSSGTDNPGSLTVRSGRLSFRQPFSKYAPFDVALDLTYDPSEAAWKGSLKNPNFSGQVVLRRPSLTSSSSLTGTWRTYSDFSVDRSGKRRYEYGCDNIGLGQDGTLVLWGEGSTAYYGTEQINGNFFGELYDDSRAQRSGNTWTFTAGNVMGGDKVTGALSSDGSSFSGFGQHYGNGFVDPNPLGHPLAWTRMPNFSCQPLVTR